VVANGENAAGGIGLTRPVADELFALGIDVLTSGNHIWDKKDAAELVESCRRIIRPANYPPGTPGRGSGVFETAAGRPVGIVNLQKIGAFDTVLARKAPKGTIRSGIAGLVKDKDLSAVGGLSLVYAWSDKGLYVVCKGGAAGTTVTFGIDGKNAKNGYITYSDRFINYAFGKDSLWVTHYKRAFANDTIKYTLAEWNTVVTRETANGVVTIEIPWYDIGMIPPTADRRIEIGRAHV
jgi:hypothetical protein